MNLLEYITSKDNPKIKEAVRLSRSRRARHEAGLFVVEGLRLCYDAVLSGIIINTTFLTSDVIKQHNEQVEIIIKASQCSVLVSNEIMDKLSNTTSPQGVFCVCELPSSLDVIEHITSGKYIFLDNVNDPANLGAIARTSEALGISGLILSDKCCDIYNTKAQRAAMGSLFRIKCFVIDDSVNCLRALKSKGFSIYGSVLNGADERLTNVDFCNNLVMVIGNEAVGISPVVLNECTKTVYIPIIGKAESLNAAAAAAILIWEIRRGEVL